MKNKTKILIFGIFSFIFIVLSILLTLQYDIYSYHVWSYISIKEGMHNVYDSSKYFDRFADYPPLGVYIAVFQGKLLSLFSPLRIGSISVLFIYKLLPLFFILTALILILHYIKIKSRIVLSIFLLSAFAISTVVNGQFDIIILMMILLGTFLLQKDKVFAGLIFIIMAIFVKQTAVFFSVFILFAYFIKSRDKIKIIYYSLSILAVLFLILFSPFILSMKLIPALKGLFSTTFTSDIFSGESFSLLSLVKDGYYLSYNFKIGMFSLKTYSLMIVCIGMIVIAFKSKRDLLSQIMLFAIIWYNFTVSVRQQHILYPLTFIVVYLIYTNGNKIWSIPFLLLSIVSLFIHNLTIPLMKLFSIPKVPYIFIQSISVMQVIASLAFVIYVMKRTKEEVEEYEIPKYIPYAFLSSMLIIVSIAFIVNGRYDSNEKELLSAMILNKSLVEYSTDKYIDLSVVTVNQKDNYLSVRMSNDAYFITKGIRGCDSILFDARVEFSDSALLLCGFDTIPIAGTVKNIKTDFNNEEGVEFKAIIRKKYSVLALYNFRYYVNE